MRPHATHALPTVVARLWHETQLAVLALKLVAVDGTFIWRVHRGRYRFIDDPFLDASRVRNASAGESSSCQVQSGTYERRRCPHEKVSAPPWRYVVQRATIRASNFRSTGWSPCRALIRPTALRSPVVGSSGGSEALDAYALDRNADGGGRVSGGVGEGRGAADIDSGILKQERL
jgi:hypothetical protein